MQGPAFAGWWPEEELSRLETSRPQHSLCKPHSGPWLASQGPSLPLPGLGAGLLLQAVRAEEWPVSP